MPFLICAIGYSASVSADENRFVYDGLALRGLDPVELTTGQEVAGAPGLVEIFGRYRYSFRNEDNRRLFLANKERYSIQFGGACMRMGPLSGGGDSERFHVHLGHIYLFASDSCLNAFLAKPERFIDTVDEIPFGPPQEEEAARMVLQKAVQAMGGEDFLRQLRTFQTIQEITQKTESRTTQLTRTIVTQFPLTHVRHDDYGEYQSAWLLRDDHGYFSWEKGAPVDESVRQFMIRELNRLPVVILKSWVEGQVIAVRTGTDIVGGDAVDVVNVFIQGAATSLSIRPTDGQVLRTEYRGRASQGISGIRRDYSDFRKVDGLVLPFSATLSIDGKESAGTTVVLKEVKVNEPVDAKLIAIPAP